MKIKHTTNYVVPKSSEELRFKEKTSPADDTDDDFDQSIWRNNADAGMIGVLDWAKGNEKYLQLLSSLGIGGVSNSELWEILKINLIIPDNDAAEYHNNSHPDQALQTHAVFLHVYWHLSRQTVWRQLRIKYHELTKIIRKFKYCLKQRTKTNQRFLNKKRKLTEAHEVYIKRLFEE